MHYMSDVLKPCVKYGDFTLHSGQKSTWICDVLELLPRFYDFMLYLHPKFPVVGIELGGALLVTATYFFDNSDTPHFGILRKDGSLYGLSSNIKGVSLVDDVVTSENSFVAATAQLSNMGIHVNEYLCILDRRPEVFKTLPIKSLVTYKDLGLPVL